MYFLESGIDIMDIDTKGSSPVTARQDKLTIKGMSASLYQSLVSGVVSAYCKHAMVKPSSPTNNVLEKIQSEFRKILSLLF